MIKLIEVALNNFNAVFKNIIVNDIKHLDLENYQEKREEQGRSPATIDMEISITKTMITKAFYNDMVDGRVLKGFNSINKKLRKGSNVRKRILTMNEYKALIMLAKSHLKAFLIIAFNTGMRRGEIRQLKWSYIDREAGIIRLPASVVKEKKEKIIPINHYVEKVFKKIPRALTLQQIYKNVKNYGINYLWLTKKICSLLHPFNLYLRSLKYNLLKVCIMYYDYIRMIIACT